MYGFMCVAATAALWDNTATYLSLPVSTTHTTGTKSLHRNQLATCDVSCVLHHCTCMQPCFSSML
jgi:hypothetical protein